MGRGQQQVTNRSHSLLQLLELSSPEIERHSTVQSLGETFFSLLVLPEAGNGSHKPIHTPVLKRWDLKHRPRSFPQTLRLSVVFCSLCYSCIAFLTHAWQSVPNSPPSFFAFGCFIGIGLKTFSMTSRAMIVLSIKNTFHGLKGCSDELDSNILEEEKNSYRNIQMGVFSKISACVIKCEDVGIIEKQRMLFTSELVSGDILLSRRNTVCRAGAVLCCPLSRVQ